MVCAFAFDARPPNKAAPPPAIAAPASAPEPLDTLTGFPSGVKPNLALDTAMCVMTLSGLTSSGFSIKLLPVIGSWNWTYPSIIPPGIAPPFFIAASISGLPVGISSPVTGMDFLDGIAAPDGPSSLAIFAAR